MSETLNTPFTAIYESFYSKITDDMYMELTPEDTAALAQDLLLSAVHKFEFPSIINTFSLNPNRFFWIFIYNTIYFFFSIINKDTIRIIKI